MSVACSLRRSAEVALLVLVVFSGSAHAGPNPVAAVEGLGQQRCGAILAAANADESVLAGYSEWIAGFLTAANMYEDETFDLTAWQSKSYFTAQVLTACRDRSDSALSDVAVAYVGFLRDERLRSASGLIVLDDQGQRYALYAEVFERIKDRLRADGHVITSVDAYGSDVRAAVEEFQQKNGIPETGMPDLPTLVALFGRR